MAALRRMGKRYGKCGLANYRCDHEAQRTIVDRLKRFVEEMQDNVESGCNALFIGPPGTGKDHLMAALVKSAFAKGYGVEWFDGSVLFADARDRIEVGGTEQDFIRRFVTPGVLAISDPLPPIGNVTDFQRLLLFRIIDRRYRDQKPTWMTMNVKDREEAEKRLSPNIVDRIGEGAAVLVCDWPSYRRGGK